MTAGSRSRRFANLPTPLSTFIGREREITKVKQLILANRLVTLTGAGGSGKTRLALKVAHDLYEKFKSRVWFIDLGSLTDSALIPQEIASTLKIQERPEWSLMDLLVKHLCLHSPLLVLDNCEHLIAACAEISDNLLQKCPDLRILATSREVLGITGEVVWTVPLLSLPSPQPWINPASAQDALSKYEESESVQLFISRAMTNCPEFKLTVHNGAWVADICRRLDGMPLAIELAAAQVRSLSVQEIAKRLDDRFQLLTGGSRTAPPRQQTLSSTIDWSYDLLPEKEQKVFRFLSVFVSGLTIEAAEVVCKDETAKSSEVYDALSHLVNKSLLEVERLDRSETRYRLLETIRAYAHEKLIERQEIEYANNRYLDFYLRLVEEAEPKLRGPEEEYWYERLEKEHDNLRAALGWALESHNTDAGLRLANGLGFFWFVRGYVKEGIGWLEQALEQRQTARFPSISAALMRLAIFLLVSEGRDSDRINQLLEESMKLYQELDDKAGIASVLNYMGIQATMHEEYTEAKRILRKSLGMRRELGEPWQIAQTLQNFYDIAMQQHDYTRAKEYSEETIIWFKRAGYQRGVARTFIDLANIARIEGDTSQALLLLTQSLPQVLQFGDKWSTAYGIELLAALENVQGNPKRAAKLYGAAEALRAAINMPIQELEQEGYQKDVAAVRRNLSEWAFTRAWAEGSAMTLEQVIRYVSDENGSTLPEKTDKEKYGGLTGREREAAVLIAQGKSNREIAEIMTISLKTVETYVTRILKKLGFVSRVQIATWVIENELI